MLITNFASGELSQTLNGRIDLQQYYQGCAKLQNFEIIPTGGIMRRTGTKRMMEIDKDCRLIPFIVDKNENFILLLTKSKLKIYRYNSDGSFVLNQAEIAMHFNSEEEVKEIQYAQNYDHMVLVHRNHRPIIIQYNLNGVVTNTFAVSEMDFDFFPDVQLDDDFDFVMVASELPENEVTSDGHLRFSYKPLGATTSVVKDYEKDVKKVYSIVDGKLWEYTASTSWIESGINTESEQGLFTTEGKYPGCAAFWNNRLYFASTIQNRQRVYASAAPDTRNTRYNDFNNYVRYVTVNKVVKEADLHMFTADMFVSDIDHTRKQFTLRNVSQDFTAGVLSKGIDNYFVTGNYIPVGAKVVSCTATTITIDTDNISINENKLNESCSIQLWRTSSSVSADDYEFQVISNEMVTADCSFYFDLASSENDAIMFLCPNSTMSIGTESSIWSLAPDASALNLNVRMQGRYGSDEIQGLSVGEACIYFAQGKKGIREFYYNSNNEAFQTNNIAILAQHVLTESPANDFDYVTNPYNRLMIARNDGVIASLLYDKNNGIMGWNRIVLGSGKVKNIAVIRGYDQWDICFFVVERDNTYTLEMYDPGQKVYLDCWKEYEQGDESIYGENAYKLETESGVYIGYKYESDIISMPVVNENEKKRIVSLSVRFLESYMPVMKCTGVSDEKFSGVTEPYSGIRKINYPGTSETDVTFELKTDKPYPVNILSVNANVV